jgi:hypothetical protein
VAPVRRRWVLGRWTGLPDRAFHARRFVDESDSAVTLMGSDISLMAIVS